ncbi:BTB/POZ domain-containing protein 2-like isoform X2 [Sitodiplosis mosellana]|uniref:BTB/POZ domain-containing protein 2-like isoform X2 n=1 Tax=Sitodiplosis mosellana TaxID=263140 RepID=UPI0024439266|nr:BTB/POZ domain-containing protein 2-like isoform X2 [Sitodiplosis mosellana]
MATTDSASKEYNVKGILNIGEKLYLNEEMADIYFDVEFNDQYERIPAHKLLLANASDVFRSMLNGSWLEKEEAKIVDASPSAFKEFLQFIYLGRVKVTTANVAQVMNMGKKYDILACLDACQDFLLNTLTNENMCMGYGLAILLEDERLMEFCENKIKCNTNEILSSSSFLDCDQKVLKRILQLDWLSCTAANVNEACMSWLKSASKQEQLTREIVQKHLGDLFYEIPFGSMSPKEFAAFDRSYESLFKADEYREIIQMFASEDCESKIFCANRGILYGISPTWNENAVVTCDRLISNRSSYFIKNVEMTTFSVNKTILLGAITCQCLYESENNIYKLCNKKVPTKIMITKFNESTDSGEEVFAHNRKVDLDKETRILLPYPILIKSGFVYKIRMEQDPPANCCTAFHLKTEVKIESGITVKFHGSTEGDDKVMEGLIYKFELYRIST